MTIRLTRAGNKGAEAPLLSCCCYLHAGYKSCPDCPMHGERTDGADNAS